MSAVQGDVAATARRLFAAGILTFPASARAKHPDRVPRWAAEHYPPDGWPTVVQHVTMFQQRDVERLFVVCGSRSGNAAAFDFDQAGYFDEWVALIPNCIFDRLYVEESQRTGGFHAACKVIGNVASRVPARDPRKSDGTDGTIRIEVRGEGNGFNAAPGIGYQRLQGDLANLPILTPQEYQPYRDT